MWRLIRMNVPRHNPSMRIFATMLSKYPLTVWSQFWFFVPNVIELTMSMKWQRFFCAGSASKSSFLSRLDRLLWLRRVKTPRDDLLGANDECKRNGRHDDEWRTFMAISGHDWKDCWHFWKIFPSKLADQILIWKSIEGGKESALKPNICGSKFVNIR